MNPTTTQLPFPALWLRDNCPCERCRDPLSHQKLLQVTDLPDDLAVVGVEERDEEVAVTFSPDGHVARFSRAWLDEQTRRGSGSGRTERDKQLWRAGDVAKARAGAAWSSYRDDDAVRLGALRAVQRLGFTILRGAPSTERTVLEVVKTFGFVRETNYGELFDVRVVAEPTNLAFTALAISPHTDNPYRDPAPTLQLLHCLENSVEGGESGLVDGFAAAAQLREEHPEHFDMLSATPVTFAWSDTDNALSARRPLIELDELARIRAVRFNNRSTQPLRLPHDRLVAFYDAVVNGATIPTDGVDGARDIALCQAIIRSAREGVAVEQPTKL